MEAKTNPDDKHGRDNARIPSRLKHAMVCDFDACSYFCERRRWLVNHPTLKAKGER